METPTLPSYDAIAEALEQLSSLAHPAETHGLMSSFICCGKHLNGKSWLEFIVGEKKKKTVKSARDLLLHLYGVTDQLIQAMGFNFELLLPSETQPLRARAEALTMWCQGFLCGLKIAGISPNHLKSEETRDAFIRFSELALIDYSNIKVTKRDEQSFFEIVEYVRLATILFYTELVLEEQDPITSHHSKKLH